MDTPAGPKTPQDKETPEIVYGRIINDGTNGAPIAIDNPVPVKRSMSVGERTRRAMALKLAGASYAAIAQQLGYHDASAARKAVMRGMKASMQETSGELRKIHYGRLEHMLMLLWPDVNARDLSSMAAALGVMDRMERLFGLSRSDTNDAGGGQRETIILADGDKETYLRALQEAGERLGGAAAAIGMSAQNDDSDEYDDNDEMDLD